MIGKKMQQSNKLLDQFRNLLPTANPPLNRYHYAMSQATKIVCERILWEALVEERIMTVALSPKYLGLPDFPKREPIDRIYGLSIVIDDSLPLSKIVVRKAEAVL